MEIFDKAKQKVESKRNKARAGEIWTINNKKVNGHMGEISKRDKNGNVEAVIFTHAKRTFGRKNIALIENPNPSDDRKSYVVKEKQKAKIKHLGKKKEGVQVKNKTDKSIIRKIKSKKR